MVDALKTCLIFQLTTFGLAWPWVARLRIPPIEKLLTSVVLSILGCWLFSWTVYITHAPTAAFYLLPVAGFLGLVLRPRELVIFFREQEVRDIAIAQLLVTATSISWLALIASYSGGEWVADWFGHWERVRFFLEHWPLQTRFYGSELLPSRPPLTNVVTGAFLAVTTHDFAHYQLISTLSGSLVFLPAALLMRHFGPSGAPAILALLFVLNPLFLQNVTYAWTKLPTAMFILAGLYFFLRTLRSLTPTYAVLCALSFAGGVLSHYSTMPCIVILAAVWAVVAWDRRRQSAWWKASGFAAAAGGAMLIPWFAWSLSVYGAQGTFLSNTSVIDQAPTLGEQIARVALNIRDTLIPHFIRNLDLSVLSQRSTCGYWRDWSFLVYQRNVFMALGCVSWIVLLVELAGRWRGTPARPKTTWLVATAAFICLGVAAHGGRDRVGNAHICLQPLVLLGLAVIAAKWNRLSSGWKRVFVAGVTVDFLVGIVLHFGVQSYLLDRWLTPDLSPATYMASYSDFAVWNLRAKQDMGLVFFSDSLRVPEPQLLALIAGLLLLMIVRARKRPSVEGAIDSGTERQSSTC